MYDDVDGVARSDTPGRSRGRRTFSTDWRDYIPELLITALLSALAVLGQILLNEAGKEWLRTGVQLASGMAHGFVVGECYLAIHLNRRWVRSPGFERHRPKVRFRPKWSIARTSFNRLLPRMFLVALSFALPTWGYLVATGDTFFPSITVALSLGYYICARRKRDRLKRFIGAPRTMNRDIVQTLFGPAEEWGTKYVVNPIKTRGVSFAVRLMFIFAVLLVPFTLIFQDGKAEMASTARAIHSVAVQVIGVETANTTEPRDRESSNSSNSESSGSTDLATSQPESHSVLVGQSFWTIAEWHVSQHLGRQATGHQIAVYWDVLKDLNTQILVEPGNVDLIRPGQDLVLPDITDIDFDSD